MNTLIIGGLFALALLAIIGVVFLVRDESHAPKVPVTKVDNEPLKVSETAQIATGGIPTQPGLPAPKQETISQNAMIAASQQKVQSSPLANGQFQKLSFELHALHEQSREIAQRLTALTEMIDRIEHDQSHYVKVNEETSHPTERVSAN